MGLGVRLGNGKAHGGAERFGVPAASTHVGIGGPRSPGSPRQEATPTRRQLRVRRAERGNRLVSPQPELAG